MRAAAGRSLTGASTWRLEMRNAVYLKAGTSRDMTADLCFVGQIMTA
jgi:hypothetical protein